MYQVNFEELNLCLWEGITCWLNKLVISFKQTVNFPRKQHDPNVNNGSFISNNSNEFMFPILNQSTIPKIFPQVSRPIYDAQVYADAIH